MDFRAEKDKKKIREFLDLVENHKVEIRHYKNPVLVWANLEGVCHYSFWEEETLERFGLANVDGWDFQEDMLFCPDWVDDEEDDEDFDDDESDEDLCKFCEKIKQ
ncbi:MAG: hypothetical protein PHT37_00595 [Candidatus Cloacimonetes bacterium]|jgi:hypothetical protein|nr:hypothetical protein [Candidatus Cloacimonadota bacterium]MDD2423406.1 hypothetical protein [Candidatus Cloacimonadota bacterium]MDD3562713.1 hypothetical protein [Candidatus Cloacimonadota bacterium]MDD4276374.1 hypothetical protein [Candidatus Cloacimonadota bacterium]MDY0324963.1 hypothetical protein [Candidatus Cloacimonadaceae bacterium]